MSANIRQTITSFKPFAASIGAIYMIEASPHLRAQQSRMLCGNEDLKETDLGWTNTCKYIPGCSIIWAEDLRFVPKGTYSGRTTAKRPLRFPYKNK